MHRLTYSQKLPISIELAWDFFSSPENLATLTPPHLAFKITNAPLTKKMYEGQIITYQIRPFMNIPMEWVTEITHIDKPFYFIDEQRIGPYTFWHHEHHFQTIPEGVEMLDVVYFKMPFWFLGKGLYFLKVKKDLETIFLYRKAKLEELFPHSI